MPTTIINALFETTVPINGAVLWEGSSTPTGWTAVTALDGYLVKGAGAAETPSTSTTYGAATHTHSNTATLLSGGAHTDHTVTIAANGWSGDTVSATSIYAGYDVSSDHSHSVSTPGTVGAASTNHTHSTIPTSGSASNYPPCRYLRWITPTSVEQDEVPVGGIVMWASATAPSGWQICNGANGAPDMEAYFVYGSSSTGTTGAASHSHTQGATPGQSATHTHTTSSGALPTGGNTSVICGSADSSGVGTNRTHTHPAVDVVSNADTGHTHTMNNSGTASSLPPYLQLCFIKRIS